MTPRKPLDTIFGYLTVINKSNIFTILIFFLASIVAFALLLWATGTYGIGISPDSTIYIDTAKNLLSGNGFVLTVNL